MGLVILLIQMLRLLLLSLALALFKIAEVLEEHCNSISGEALNEGDRISIGDSTSTNDDLTLKEPEGDEAGEPVSCHEASANCAEDVVIVSPKPDTAAAEPRAAMVSHQTQTENATLKYSPQGKQSVPQITDSRGIRQLIRVRFPSSTGDGPSAAGAAPPSYVIRYNDSGAFPYRNAVSPVVVLSSRSTGSLQDFKPKPDLRYNLPSCNGPAAKIEPVQISPMSPQLSSQKGLSESAMSNRTFHAAPIVPAHASRATSPSSEISSETSDDTSLPSDGGISGETDQQSRKVTLSQPFMPKTPDRHDKLRKERDYLNPYDSAGRDSGYASATESVTGTPNTAPRSDATATPEIVISRPGAQANCEHLKELHDMKEASRVWKKLLYYHPQWLVGAIPLDHLITDYRKGEHSYVQLLVLDRQEGKHILLSRALSSRELRARTGLRLALYNTKRGEYITQLEKALAQGTPPKDITATIHMWNRQTSLFENLADMLARPDWRAITGLRLQHSSSTRHCTRLPRANVLSWPKFVRATDIVDYYLEILCNKMVAINAEMDCYNGPMHHCLGSDDDEGMKLHEAFGQTCTQT